jgi:poly [ADP-ribose] polymerase
MRQQNVDLSRLPLGDISQQAVMDGYAILSDLAAIISAVEDATNTNTATAIDSRARTRIRDLSQRFYTTIPHSFSSSNGSGRRAGSIPLIDTNVALVAKVELVETLIQLKHNQRIERWCAEAANRTGGVCDRDIMRYATLDSELTPLDPDCEELRVIETYATQTHSQDHAGYRVKVVQAFRVDRAGEKVRFDTKLKQCPHLSSDRRLLWHGSPVSNWSGILSQGLRIAPPEAPVSGYMFGKGVYFADMVSKSAQYCRTPTTGGDAVLLLSEVALGRVHEMVRSDTSAASVCKLAGKDSVFARGLFCPNPQEDHIMDDGVRVPLGTAGESGGSGSGGDNNARAHTDLRHNEFIVYDEDQVRQRYVLHVKMEASI